MVILDCGQRVHRENWNTFFSDFRHFGIVFVMMMVLAPQQVSMIDPCTNPVILNQDWRNVAIDNGNQQPANGHCDKGMFTSTAWYSFALDSQPATIPTACVKNNMCGASIGMRVELEGQTLPEQVGQNISASLCGAYNVLGKYDCCVLRAPVIITRCPSNTYVYQFPQPPDRCPVAICTKKMTAPHPPLALAQHGELASIITVPATTIAASIETTTPNPQIQNDDPNAEFEYVTETTASPTTNDNGNTTVYSADDGINRTSSESTVSSTINAVTSNTDLTTTMVNTVVTTQTTADGDNSTYSTPGATDSSSPSSSSSLSSNSSQETPKATITTSTSFSTAIATASPLTPKSQEDTSDMPAKIATMKTKPSSPFSSPSPPVTTISSSQLPSLSTSSPMPLSTTSSSSPPSIASTSAASSLSVSSPSLQTAPSSSSPSSSSSSSPSSTTSSSLPSLSSSSQQPMTSSSSLSSSSIMTTSFLPSSSPSSSSSSSLSSSPSPSPSSPSPQPPSTTSPSPSSPPVLTNGQSTVTTTPTTSVFLSTLISRAPTTSHTEQPTPPQDPPPSSSSTSAISSVTPAMPGTNESDIVEVLTTEQIRLVFKEGNLQDDVQFPSKMAEIIRRFLLDKASELSGDRPAFVNIMSVERVPQKTNESTILNILISHSTNGVALDTFQRWNLNSYIYAKTNLTLVAACRPSKKCGEHSDQQDGLTTPDAVAGSSSSSSSMEKNLPVLIAVLCVCGVCIVVMITGVICAKCRHRGVYKADSRQDIHRHLKDSRTYFDGTQSPFTDLQIMKDETARREGSLTGSAEDGGADKESTWVVPLEEVDLDNEVNNGVVAKATEDTKL